jgi:hypothetical protein
VGRLRLRMGLKNVDTSAVTNHWRLTVRVEILNAHAMGESSDGGIPSEEGQELRGELVKGWG